jgi:dTDP-4-amino-4,6-dideoxygalactose transaminase
MPNGTSALHSAYFAVGVGPGDEVIVPTYTWHATITPILHCAATPVFCDIDATTLTIDPDDIERKITPRTKAICIVHVFGNVCDMDRITEICRKHNLILIEDCSHAHGASWNGQKVGSFGAVGCFSLQGGKPVSGGECGIATTNSAQLMDHMILLGHFGRAKFETDTAIAQVGDMTLGAKYRAHPYAVALAFGDLKRLGELNEKRTANYALLNDHLRDCPGIEVIDALPQARRGGYLEFKFKLSNEILALTDRNTIVEAIQAEGAPVDADRYSDFNYTYGLLHTAPLFRRFDLHSVGGCFYDPSRNGEAEAVRRETPVLPAAEDLARRLITVPAYTDVEAESLEQTADAMSKVLRNIVSL